MSEKTNKVTIGEISRKLDGHILRQDKFEKKVFDKIDDLNFILKVFRGIGWLVTVVTGAIAIWATNTFLNRG